MAKIDAYVGIDPGKNGALALICNGKNVAYHCPTDEAGMSDILFKWSWQYRICMAALERVWAMPGEGAVGAFTFGVNVGIWRGILTALQIPFTTPTPKQWRKGLVGAKGGKEESLSVARRMFPDVELKLKKDIHRAEALLLAVYAKRFLLMEG